ncbi:MAG: PSD1 and planctomycete cytochrome C domain-containing protein [Planctomycetaceae bacterium]
MHRSVVLLIGIVLRCGLAQAADDGVAFFETNIRPQLVEHCYACHSAAAAERQTLKGNLRLDTHEGLRRGGENGPIIVSRSPEDSLLISAIRYESLEMPPGGKLPDRVVADFSRWVEIGAPLPRDAALPSPGDARKHWAFQPVRPPDVPDVQDGSWPRDDLDRFILAGLESAGRRPAPHADRRTLIRRASYDLIGLPPTSRQIEEFLASEDPSVWASLVDELLDSPQFGVHWARMWLDNVRFAQDDYTCAAFQTNEFDPTPYRDWLVRAFNDDLPYDEFVQLQVAGDLIPHEDPDLVNADGITATGIWTFPHIVADNDPDKVLVDFVDQQLEVLGGTFLGLTLACARCHDHKFDPLTQQDYYGLAGIFLSSHSLSHWNPETGEAPHARAAYRVTTPVFSTQQELAEYERSLAEIDRLQAQIKQLKDDHAAAFELRKVRGRIQHQMNREVKTEREGQDRDSVIARLRIEETKLLEQIAPSFLERQADGIYAEHDRLTEQAKLLQEPLGKIPRRPAMREGGSPGTRYSGKTEDVPVFIRGQHHVFGDVAPRDVPAVLRWGREPLMGARTAGSGRLELAQWLVDPQHPLTARVMVNRIWQQLFGAGLVRTPGNFGVLGARPAHPQLLDHLAHRFVTSGWSIKQLLQEIVLSATYQQDSRVEDEHWTADPENLLLGRQNRRRLTGEQLYDTLQELGGTLHRDVPQEQLADSGRALYRKVSRIETPHPLAMQFDVPDASLVIPQRSETTAATQSLLLLDNPLVLDVARHCAAQTQSGGNDEQDAIARVFRQIYGRAPTDEECELAAETLEQFRNAWRHETAQDAAHDERDISARAWRDLCHVLLCGSEFLYVD